MGHSEAEVRKSIRVYITVFVALLVLTVVTVAVSYLELTTAPAVALALFVASIKATLVAGYFMHLLSEKKIITAILWLTAFFFIILLLWPAMTS